MVHVLVNTLEELFVEKCYDLITTAALRAMGKCKSLKVWVTSRHSLPAWHALAVVVAVLACKLAALLCLPVNPGRLRSPKSSDVLEQLHAMCM